MSEKSVKVFSLDKATFWSYFEDIPLYALNLFSSFVMIAKLTSEHNFKNISERGFHL